MSNINYISNANHGISKYKKAIGYIDEALELLQEALTNEQKIKGLDDGKQLEIDIASKIENLKTDKKKLGTTIIQIDAISKRLDEQQRLANEAKEQDGGI